MKKSTILFIVALSAGVVLHILTTAFAASDPERLLRPDSPGYLIPAQALAENFTYPTTMRPPGYPLVAAALYACGGSNQVLAVAGMIFALGGCAVIYFAAKCYGGSKCAAAAVLLSLFNLTLIANAPLLLSDTLFFLFASCQFYAFAKFHKSGKLCWLLTCAGIAGAATLIRPVNLLFIFPLLVLTAIQQKLSWRQKSAYCAAAAAVFAVLILPWMYRNYACGATFAIDTNTGAMRHQNGAMLMAEVNGTDFESEKSRLLSLESQQHFPDPRSREKWRISEFQKMVLAHPLIYLRQHFDWRIMLPDAPTLLENFGVTSANRGTMGVLKKSGFTAAVKHYFGKNWLFILLPLVPLLFAVGVLYAAAAARLLTDAANWRSRWRELVIFLAFCEYYLFLPGAITAPRYQLPALPLLCTLAGCMISAYVENRRAAEN